MSCWHAVDMRVSTRTCSSLAYSLLWKQVCRNGVSEEKFNRDVDGFEVEAVVRREGFRSGWSTHSNCRPSSSSVVIVTEVGCTFSTRLAASSITRRFPHRFACTWCIAVKSIFMSRIFVETISAFIYFGNFVAFRTFSIVANVYRSF